MCYDRIWQGLASCTYLPLAFPPDAVPKATDRTLLGNEGRSELTNRSATWVPLQENPNPFGEHHFVSFGQIRFPGCNSSTWWFLCILPHVLGWAFPVEVWLSKLWRLGKSESRPRSVWWGLAPETQKSGDGWAVKQAALSISVVGVMALICDVSIPFLLTGNPAFREQTPPFVNAFASFWEAWLEIPIHKSMSCQFYRTSLG